MATQRPQPVILDGGLATQLEAQGHDIDNPLWSAAMLVSNPGAIVDAHLAYLAAGAEVVTSASYQASRAGLHQLGYDAAEADGLIASSVRLAQDAVDRHRANGGHAAKVAASVGPYGAVLHDGSEYTGDYGVPAGILQRFHVPRLEVLDGSGADLLAVETIPAALEAQVLAELLAQCRTPAWVSFCCRDGASLSDGSPVAEAAARFANHPTVFGVGINCTAPGYVLPLIGELRRAAPDKAVVVYPNSGESWSADGNRWSGGAQGAGFADAAAEWFDAGATHIGGCCRVGPQKISELRARWPLQAGMPGAGC